VAYRDNGRGSFTSADGEELVVGWREYIGFENFTSVITNPLVRQPFLRAFVWTIGFAGSTVLLSFAIGLFLAKVIDKPNFRGKRLYRSMLVIPYAIPGFLSLLVFKGLLNDDYGLINKLLPFDPPWLFDPWWARLSVILVSVWLTTPYFLLVCMGALQSIPAELVEAARVDGAGQLAGVPKSHAASSSGGGDTPVDCVIRVQLQQLQQRVLADGWWAQHR